VTSLLFLALLQLPPVAHAEAPKRCTCTCVVKDDDGSYTTRSATGKNREEAGEALKKAIGRKKTCELTPDCAGAGCKLD
jgi:hypothetical protein